MTDPQEIAAQIVNLIAKWRERARLNAIPPSNRDEPSSDIADPARWAWKNVGIAQTQCADELEPVAEAIASALTQAQQTTTHEKEQCICAAIQLPNGEVWRGHRHDSAIHTAMAAPDVTKKDIFGAEQGFITSRNRFVGREEGAEIQRRAGIVSATTGCQVPTLLFSEDLYLRDWRSGDRGAEPPPPHAATDKQVADARNLLQTITGPCVGTDDHSWRKCKRCTAMHGIEMRFPLSLRLLSIAITALPAPPEAVHVTKGSEQ